MRNLLHNFFVRRCTYSCSSRRPEPDNLGYSAIKANPYWNVKSKWDLNQQMPLNSKVPCDLVHVLYVFLAYSVIDLRIRAYAKRNDICTTS